MTPTQPQKHTSMKESLQVCASMTLYLTPDVGDVGGGGSSQCLYLTQQTVYTPRILL